MSAILCVAALHLAFLCPDDTKYVHASMHLIIRTVQLFRKNLSRPFTKDNCESLMGAALLINYISWSDLSFLHDIRADKKGLDLEHDQLFLMSPGIVRLWFAAMPVFIDQGSVFVQLTRGDPRGRIERALIERGEDPARFVEPFMRMWDDDRLQTRNAGCTLDREMGGDGPTSYAWRFLRGLERDLLPCRRNTLKCDGGHDEQNGLLYLRDTVTKLTASLDYQPESSRSSFKYVIRRMSPLLCCAALLDATGDEPTVESCATDIEQLFYGFPILCCGPVAELVSQKDSRTLVFLFHFYRAARMLLGGDRCWWASKRSDVMAKVILQEMQSRGIDTNVIMIR
jgi:hypothetical protein